VNDDTALVRPESIRLDTRHSLRRRRGTDGWASGLAGAPRPRQSIHRSRVVRAMGRCGLTAGMLALIRGQPWGIWFGFLLPGAVGTLVVGANSLVILKRYREVEERRLSAKDLL